MYCKKFYFYKQSKITLWIVFNGGVVYSYTIARFHNKNIHKITFQTVIFMSATFTIDSVTRKFSNT